VSCSAVVDRETIDEINILQAAMLAMQQAVEGLAATPDAVLIDGNRCAMKHYASMFSRPASTCCSALCSTGPSATMLLS
jgi:ribonuclease HII